MYKNMNGGDTFSNVLTYFSKNDVKRAEKLVHHKVIKNSPSVRKESTISNSSLDKNNSTLRNQDLNNNLNNNFKNSKSVVFGRTNYDKNKLSKSNKRKRVAWEDTKWEDVYGVVNFRNDKNYDENFQKGYGYPYGYNTIDYPTNKNYDYNNDNQNSIDQEEEYYFNNNYKPDTDDAAEEEYYFNNNYKPDADDAAYYGDEEDPYYYNSESHTSSFSLMDEYEMQNIKDIYYNEGENNFYKRNLAHQTEIERTDENSFSENFPNEKLKKQQNKSKIPNYDFVHDANIKENGYYAANDENNTYYENYFYDNTEQNEETSNMNIENLQNDNDNTNNNDNFLKNFIEDFSQNIYNYNVIQSQKKNMYGDFDTSDWKYLEGSALDCLNFDGNAIDDYKKGTELYTTFDNENYNQPDVSKTFDEVTFDEVKGFPGYKSIVNEDRNKEYLKKEKNYYGLNGDFKNENLIESWFDKENESQYPYSDLLFLTDTTSDEIVKSNQEIILWTSIYKQSGDPYVLRKIEKCENQKYVNMLTLPKIKKLNKTQVKKTIKYKRTTMFTRANNVLIRAMKNINLKFIQKCFKNNKSMQWLLNVRGYRNTTSLIEACKSNVISADIVQTILSRKAKINLYDSQGFNALHYAVKTGQRKKVRLLLSRQKQGLVNNVARGGVSPLHIACQKGHVRICSDLLRHGAKVNYSNKWKYSALHYACRYGNQIIVESLLAAGANPNCKNKFGQTSLMIAAQFGNYKSILTLMKCQRTDICIKCKKNMMCFEYAKDKFVLDFMLKQCDLVTLHMVMKVISKKSSEIETFLAIDKMVPIPSTNKLPDGIFDSNLYYNKFFY